MCEPPDHTAETQLKEICDMLDEINSLRTGNERRFVVNTLVFWMDMTLNFSSITPKICNSLSLYDIEGIVFDSTSSNTGEKKGLAGMWQHTNNTHLLSHSPFCAQGY